MVGLQCCAQPQGISTTERGSKLESVSESMNGKIGFRKEGLSAEGSEGQSKTSGDSKNVTDHTGSSDVAAEKDIKSHASVDGNSPAAVEPETEPDHFEVVTAQVQLFEEIDGIAGSHELGPCSKTSLLQFLMSIQQLSMVIKLVRIYHAEAHLHNPDSECVDAAISASRERIKSYSDRGCHRKRQYQYRSRCKL